MLGPSLGPILGGALTQGFNWRATFWFLAIFTGLCTLSFVFFRDTFRRERSLTYQTVLKRVLEHEAKRVARQAVAEKAAEMDDARTAVVPPPDEKCGKDAEGGAGRDVEAQSALAASELPQAVKEVKLSLKDVNPVVPMIRVLYRPNNVVILFASGTPRWHVEVMCKLLTPSLYFCRAPVCIQFQYYLHSVADLGQRVSLRCSRHWLRTPCLWRRCVALPPPSPLLSPNPSAGCLLGSVLGGRYSDHIFRKLKAEHGGKTQPEVRILYSIYARWTVHAEPVFCRCDYRARLSQCCSSPRLS